MTQSILIKKKLLKDGKITNVWAVNHFIFRLSERIRELSEDGWKFDKHYEVKRGRKTKTYVYDLVGKGQ